MNINDAKAIPLHKLVEALGGRYSKSTKKGILWYHSPFRPDERTASFQIDEVKNRWHDFGLVSTSGSAGGDIIDLWCDYHHQDRKLGFKAALEGLAQFSTLPNSTGYKPLKRAFKSIAKAKPIDTEEPRFKILKLHNGLFFAAIKEEAARRRISLPLASKYLKQVYLQDTEIPNRKLNGFAFKNDKGGWEISIPNPATNKAFKTSTSPKWFTTIEGFNNSVVCVFEGFWDFLTWMEMQKAMIPPNKVYVLNSVSFTAHLVDLLLANQDEIKTIKLYTDNDDAGRQAAMIICEALDGSGIVIGSMEQSYDGAKDLNEWWVIKFNF
jgi:hypothetical protein